MTPGNEDLLCLCGKHSARFREGKGKRAKAWIVLEAKDGKAPQIKTTRAEKQKAWEAVNKLCQGCYIAPRQKTAAAAAPYVDRELRESSRLRVDYKENGTQPTKAAGPGVNINVCACCGLQLCGRSWACEARWRRIQRCRAHFEKTKAK